MALIGTIQATSITGSTFPVATAGISGTNDIIGVTGSVVFAGADADIEVDFPSLGTDTGFYVSGTAGAKGDDHNERGTAVFGGDTVVSGTFYSSKISVGDSAHEEPTTTALNVYGNVYNDYVAKIDNDRGSHSHVLKLSSDGDGVNTRILEIENKDGVMFRARADGRFGFGSSGVSSLGAADFVVGIDGDSASDIAISKRLQHLGDGDTYIEFPAADQITLRAGGRDFINIVETNEHDQVLILSGGGSGMNTNAAAADDVTFYVSGTNTAWGDSPHDGVSLIDGHLHISGTVRAEHLRVDGSMLFGYNPGGSVGTTMFMNGLSGSLTQLADGKSYLVAGSGITIQSESNGQVFIGSSGGGGGSSPGGSDGYIQYNNGGSFGGATPIYYNDTYGFLKLGADGHMLEISSSYGTVITGTVYLSSSYAETAGGALLINTSSSTARITYGSSMGGAYNMAAGVAYHGYEQGAKLHLEAVSGSNPIASDESNAEINMFKRLPNDGEVAGGTAYGDGSTLGQIIGWGWDGHGKYVPAAGIYMLATGSIDDTHVPGQIRFSTNNGGSEAASYPLSRLVIESGGEVVVKKALQIQSAMIVTGTNDVGYIYPVQKRVVIGDANYSDVISVGHNTAPYNNPHPDSSFVVSGVVGSKSYVGQYVSTFSGDLYVSGNIYGKNSQTTVMGSAASGGGTHLNLTDKFTEAMSYPGGASNLCVINLPRIDDFIHDSFTSTEVTIFQYGDGGTTINSYSSGSDDEYIYNGSQSQSYSMDTKGDSVTFKSIFSSAGGHIWMVTSEIQR